MGAQLSLHLQCGIPVVELQGEWTDDTDRVLADTVDRLTCAGHFEIIVNLSRATRIPLPERKWLQELEKLTASVRAHFGRLDFVATLDQVESTLRRCAKPPLWWDNSEEEAICRLKGIRNMTRGPILTSRLAGR